MENFAYGEIDERNFSYPTPGKRHLSVCLTLVQRNNCVSVMVQVCVGYHGVARLHGVLKPNRCDQSIFGNNWPNLLTLLENNLGVAPKSFNMRIPQPIMPVPLRDGWKIMTSRAFCALASPQRVRYDRLPLGICVRILDKGSTFPAWLPSLLSWMPWRVHKLQCCVAFIVHEWYIRNSNLVWPVITCYNTLL